MESIEEPKNLLDNPLEQFNKAQKWCKAYGFKCNDPCYPKLIHAFIAGYGIDRKPTLAAIGADQIDKLCVKSARGINKINYKLAHKAAFMSHESRVALIKERDCMRDILIHFHGSVDNDFVAMHRHFRAEEKH